MADIVIGGRLHSAATGNTVAGANEIMDDAQGKKQSVVNQELANRISVAGQQQQAAIEAEAEARAAKDRELKALIDQGIIEGGGIVFDTEPTPDSVNPVTSNGIAGTLGYNTDNVEFIRVVVDSQNRVVFGIQHDGNVYFGAGVPRQIQEYVRDMMDNIDLTDITTTLEQITDYLTGKLGTQLTLSDELDGKVDKEEGKSLIDAEYASCVSHVENPEFVEVHTDSEGRVLWGIRSNGDFYIGAGVPESVRQQIEAINTSVNEKIAAIKAMYGDYEDNPEYVWVILDADDRVLFGIRTDGSLYLGNELPQEYKQAIQAAYDYVDQKFTEVADIVEALKRIITVWEDPEGRLQITVDAEGRMLSYRDKEGVKHENYLSVDKSLLLSEESMEKFQKSLIDSGFNPSRGSDESIHLPKYGTVNIKQETFYLVKTAGVASLSDVHVEQVLPDTDANAKLRLCTGRFFKNGSTEVVMNFASSEVAEENGVYYAHTKVKKINGVCYYQNTLGTSGADHPVRDTVVAGYSIEAPSDASLAEGETKDIALEVEEYVWTPDISVWFIDKGVEHNCIVDVDFGHYFSKTNAPIGVKYQGASTTTKRKKNFRFTFYKNDTYGKKEKIKIGEMVRLSGYNLKANWSDNTRVKELVLFAVLLSVWKHRPITDRFPWDKEFGYYTGATGFIEGFPISTYIGGTFYGLQIFSIKKDERNYLLDGDDDRSGIFVCGSRRDSSCWTTAKAEDWEDEMMDEMSQETADALNDFFAFINNRLDDGEGGVVEFNSDTAPERLDVLGFIDYFICMQAFLMWDSICRNLILHSRSDKKKFYPFFYDLDLSLNYAYNDDIFDIAHDATTTYDMSFWRNIKDMFWDDIVNRWCELRNTVLNIDYIKHLFHSLVDEIPESVFEEERAKWGVAVYKDSFNAILDKIELRLEWLDKNYYNV